VPAEKLGRRLAPLPLGLALGALALALVAASLVVGWGEGTSLGAGLRGAAATFGLAEPLAGTQQLIVELRLWRALTAVGVGAGLALSGGLLQGVFRNDLASPSVIGVTSGASLGASIAILLVGGYGPAIVSSAIGGRAPLFVTGAAFLGALAVCGLVTLLSTAAGRISVPTLLLVGVALNVMTGGMLAAIQSFALTDFDVGRALIAWTFGSLDDRTPIHVWIAALGVGLAAAVIPFVALELDLFAGGEEDAQTLGVDPGRVKLLALLAAALAAAVAVAVAGQIAFVGLVVPHLVRLTVGSSHRRLLPLCLLGGPVFLLGADVAQRWLLGGEALQPGVLMSLVGGPFFLFLLVKNKRALRAW
jgi:iron complex transport system permease protein